jgi:hypothetical protein
MLMRTAAHMCTLLMKTHSGWSAGLGLVDPEGQNVVYSLAAPPITVFYMHLINKQHPYRCLERVGCEPLQRTEFPTLLNQCNHGANGVRNEVAVQRSVCLSESSMNTKVIQII